MITLGGFTLTSSEQFGPRGPQSGNTGVAFESFSPPGDDRKWYRCLFDGFEGYYLLPETMMRFDDQ